MASTVDELIEAWSDVAAQGERTNRLVELASRCTGDEQRRAEAYLAQCITDGDVTAVIVAREVRWTGLAPLLESQLVEAATPNFKVELVAALQAMRGPTGLEDYLIEVVDKGGCATAVRALGTYRGLHVVEALVRALNDADHDVRFAAVDSLLAAAGLVDGDERRFGRLEALLESNHEALRAAGIAWFRRVQQALREERPLGDLAADLVVAERSAAFEAFYDRYAERDEEDETLPDDDRLLLAALTEDERFRAEYGFLRDLCEGTARAWPCLEAVAGELTREVAGYVAKDLEKAAAAALPAMSDPTARPTALSMRTDDLLQRLVNRYTA